jgi:ABC-type Na+ transport system ATPase subunit NatA
MKPEMRRTLAQLPFEEKIRKVGELIRLRQKIKTDVSNVSEEAGLLASLDKAAAELNAGKGVPIERVRENIREWATSPKNPKK